jgi:hypothetical protein
MVLELSVLLLQKIVESFYALEERGIDVEFRWVPGVQDTPGSAGTPRQTEQLEKLQAGTAY